jgi:fatty acyl-CoA reductase
MSALKIASLQGSHSLSGAHLLLTGATGFVGKVVLAELVRRREELGLERIYVLARGKKDRNAEQRFAKEVVESPCFSLLGNDWPAYCQVIHGELTHDLCDISKADQKTLTTRVTHIIHCAASVDFDLPVEEAANSNITAALNVLTLAQKCLRLKHMVSVSTAYVTPWQADQGPVPEQLVPLPISAAETYKAILDGTADEKELLKVTGHPNTYTFTKCVAEHLLSERRGHVPISIVRPSVVSACLEHPFPAWIDSAAAFAGFVALIGTGHLRVLVADRQSRLDVVPCDIVAKRVIDTCFLHEAERPMRIRYAVAGLAQNPTSEQSVFGIVKFFQNHIVDRYPNVSWIGPPSRRFALEELRHHRVPLKVARFGLRAAQQHKKVRQAKRVGEKLKFLNRAFPYFTHNTFDFHCTDATHDTHWTVDGYIELICRGVYRHLMKKDATQMVFAGKQHKDNGQDLLWVLNQPQGNWAIRAFALAIRKALRQCATQVTFDRPSFEAAVRALPPNSLPVLVPSHRSYMDFLLCSYLFFDRPDLRIAIPHIAAAEEFSRIPILGELFRHTHAFYLKRGQGKADTELTRQVHELVEKRQTLQFFIEGQRSRSRQFLAPRTGLLRCLQSTGERFTMLPIAITYDRVPEEESLIRELTGYQKPEMQLAALLRWTARMMDGKVHLGRIHLACGAPVAMDLQSDPRVVGRTIMAELQGATATTTHHLRAFLLQNQLADVDATWLRQAIEARGGVVLDSPLAGEVELDSAAELCMRHNWQHWFYADARATWPDHPVVRHHVSHNGFASAQAVQLDELRDPRLQALLTALFAPVVRDYRAVADALGPIEWPPRHGSPQTVLYDAPEAYLPYLQGAFADLTQRGVLVAHDQLGHTWGHNAHALPHYLAACANLDESTALWPESATGT